MSFFWGRFDPIEGPVEEELKNLYRRRELDDQYKNKTALIVAMTPTASNNLDNIKVLDARKLHRLDSPAYDTLTEEERIENGLPSRYLIFNTSIYNMFGTGVCMGYALLCYSRIYYPGGVILRRQRKEKLAGYLKKRLPIVALSLYTVYNMLFYKLKYTIDYRSDNEDEIDREYSKIKKLAI